MKPEEALKVVGDWVSIETSKRRYEKCEVIELSDALITLKTALEKQVAKKPNVKELPDAFGRLYWNVCGACDEEIESDYDYCPDCGQRIDWSVEE